MSPLNLRNTPQKLLQVIWLVSFIASCIFLLNSGLIQKCIPSTLLTEGENNVTSQLRHVRGNALLHGASPRIASIYAPNSPRFSIFKKHL